MTLTIPQYLQYQTDSELSGFSIEELIKRDIEKIEFDIEVGSKYRHIVARDEYYAQFDDAHHMLGHISYPSYEEYVEEEKKKYYDDGSPRPQIHWNK